MLNGHDARAPFLLNCLAIDPPRYRDCYLKDGQICVLTRTGGGNRDDYVAANEEMMGHRNYLWDKDCDWDCTYAEWYFSFPEEHKAKLDEMWAAAQKEEKPKKTDLQAVFFGERQ